MDHHNLLFSYIQRHFFFFTACWILFYSVNVVYLDLKFIHQFMFIDRLMFKNIHFNHSLICFKSRHRCFSFFKTKIWIGRSYVRVVDQQTLNRLINLFIEMWWKSQPTKPIFMKLLIPTEKKKLTVKLTLNNAKTHKELTFENGVYY